jgi:hypothetical protein
VMELVDGPTLADRIARGAISAAVESKLGHHRGEEFPPERTQHQWQQPERTLQ